MGFSVGHWDGNDLVLVTTGFNDKTWLKVAGYPHSEALHVTEQFHRIDQNHLRLDITIDDPKSFSQTWKLVENLTLEPPREFSESFGVPANPARFKTEIMEPNAKPNPQK